MKQKIMKKWVEALRSGKFKQGKGKLKQYNSKGDAKHCCLGVLCELYNQDMKKNKKKTLPENICYDGFSELTVKYSKFATSDIDLPELVQNWAGLKSNYEDGELVESLANLNDDGKKFKTIANIIEKNWENL